MRDVINDDRNKSKKMPETRQAIMDGARMHIPSQMMRAPASTERQAMPMVYTLSEAQLKHPCNNCKQLGHWARECPEPDTRKAVGKDDDKKVSRESEASKKTHEIYHVVNVEDEEVDNGYYGYSFRVDGNINAKLHEREVALDTFANVDFIANKELLGDMRDASIVVKGFNGEKQVSQVGNLPGFGEAVYAPWVGVNGLAMCKVEDLYDVSYFQKDRIEVKVNDELTLKFWFKNELGCYACMFDDELVSKLREHETRFNYCNIVVVSEREKAH